MRKIKINFASGLTPNVKGRHAFKYPIWWLYFMKRHSLFFKNSMEATEARRLRTGQAMITGIMFLLFASLILIFGISLPLLSQMRMFGGLKNSNQSFYASEGAVEDAVLKVKRGQNVLSQSSLFLNDAEVSVLVSDILGGKEITAEGDSDNHIRKVKSSVSVGEGVTFHYGVQTGNGGFILRGNAGVVGNVYSNGSITGDNGAYISASAVSANSSALSSNQTNNIPTTPTGGIIFGQTSVAEDIAQSFIVSENGPINKVRLNLRKTSTPGNITVRIMSDSNDSPSSTTLTSVTLGASLVTTQFGFVEVVFPTNPELTTGTNYWLVLDVSNNSNRYYEWAKNTDYTSGLLKNGRVGSSWGVVSPSADGYFEIYLGGLLGSIDNVDVGQSGVGDAWAHTVNNSSVAGNLYCQTGTGNNKSCDDTTQPDPSATAFPISDANIAEWKDWALVGGTISGDYSVDDTSATLGPKKINGNLTVSNGGRLDVTGTLWVTGNIIVLN
ncbi:MAG: choice-of-anchor R domain-containing protein, partial [Patescibacteria group bacterium]